MGLVWHRGSPPEDREEGGLCLIILKSQDKLDYPIEHYFKPIIVTQYGCQLKTTVNPTRIAYQDVDFWAEFHFDGILEQPGE